MKRRMQGFTLIEIMVVVVILGILASIIVPKIMDRPEQAKVIKAKQDILAIENSLDLYKLDNGFYPSTEQGLASLTKKPSSEPVPAHWKNDGYLKQVPQDPWGHEYHYLNPGQHGTVDVFTYGASDKQDDKTVIGNW